ncbi:MAG: tetratricopeptide repeat protein [Blastocatellia bacterium]|nr:tetratricopeptide repeat protein [Blastocatellia bacterium]
MNYNLLYYELVIWLAHLGRVASWVVLDCVLLFVGLRWLLLGLYASRVPTTLRNGRSGAGSLLWASGVFLALAGSLWGTFRPDHQFQMHLAAKASIRGDYEAVLDAYAPLVAVGTTDFTVYKDCAICTFHLGRYGETVAFFKQAQKYGADRLSPNAYLVCALAYEQLGHPTQAIEKLREALAKPHSKEETARLQEQLDRLQGIPPTSQPH